MDMWYNGIAALLFYFVSEQSERNGMLFMI